MDSPDPLTGPSSPLYNIPLFVGTVASNKFPYGPWQQLNTISKSNSHCKSLDNNSEKNEVIENVKTFLLPSSDNFIPIVRVWRKSGIWKMKFGG